MTNIERIKMETKGVGYPDGEISIYLEENNLNPDDEYNPKSNANKRGIYSTALALLESLANQPALLKSYKHDDMTVYDFADSLQSRIKMLERKLRMMQASDDTTSNSNTFMLFNS
ncbi:hypothetical protein [Paenibacillus bouchesdurhonensis]|uniref:hypothetical protein n=1 Tax=Paenibacillus bouchesdurhonensis TaxID=1870990 RepID=UPI000DA607B9|nr:hypothetical protein [Paenibacillus bouchesdurhonensis]